MKGCRYMLTCSSACCGEEYPVESKTVTAPSKRQWGAACPDALRLATFRSPELVPDYCPNLVPHPIQPKIPNPAPTGSCYCLLGVPELLHRSSSMPVFGAVW
ncbi:hypothetical protein J6590_089285 [Homalodisca vitripennis]|nr:hypothetical protein J6590_089285 [Homalodisca vitripennis]